MFDLDIIEKDWLNNSYKLSEEEIIEIYRSENITLNKYYEEMEQYRKNTQIQMPAEERLLLAVFGEDKEIIKREEELRAKYEYPTKKRLSNELQKKVVEGSLDIVFEETRYWYKFFEEKIEIEILYYICLEALINSTKYMIHCEKPVFKLYVLKSIKRNVIKYIAKWEHKSYREVYTIVNNYHVSLYDILGQLKPSEKTKLNFNCDNNEEPEKPTKIFYRTRNNAYNVDYIKNISAIEFMKDYNESLEELDEVAKLVMQLSFDKDGNPGLTYNEIADYLGIEINNVANAKKRAIRKLRKILKK